MSDLVRVVSLDNGAFWRITFGAPPGNILDCKTMAALTETFRKAGRERALRAVCLEGGGSDFSYGASVQEHRPAEVGAMLVDFRILVTEILHSAVVVVAAVRGQCLGGGLELAAVCHRIVSSPDAMFGQPEIALGVFAPVASIVLPERIGRARAEDLLLTGRAIPASEAKAIGLVDEIAPDPAEAAIAWARAHLVAKSASSLRFAVRAVRADLTRKIVTELPQLETTYIDGLMQTRDAVEGITAFLEKRRPDWKDE